MPAERAWMVPHSAELWNGECVISRGVAHTVAELSGFVARMGGERVGVATYRFGDDECELVTIDAFRPRVGVGTALLSVVIEAIYLGAIERSRSLKPQIPLIGENGIPIRDELLLVYSGQIGKPHVSTQ